MIPNWDAVARIYGGLKLFGLCNWAIVLVKQELSPLGLAIASIVIREQGTTLNIHSPMSHGAEILATVYSERFVFEFPTMRQFTEEEYQTWVREREINITKGVSTPSETALNTILESHNTNGVEFG